MYTILMNADKTLTQTVRTNLFQKESLIEKLQFLIPQTYGTEEYDLSDFTWTLTYTDPGNVPHIENLIFDETLYKDKFLRATLPIDSELSYLAGDISLSLSAVTSNDGKAYVLKTYETTITIQPLKNLYDAIPEDFLSPIDARIADLAKKAEALEIMGNTYSAKLPNDLAIDENDKIHLVHDNTVIGEGVEILVPNEDPDGENDGEIIINSNTFIEI